MQVAALKKLLRLHLILAHKLKLLDVASESEVEKFCTQSLEWDSKKLTPDKKFDTAVELAKYKFQTNWRYLSSTSETEVYISRVTPLKYLGYAIDGTSPSYRPDFKKIQKSLNCIKPDFPKQYNDPLSASIKFNISKILIEFGDEFSKSSHPRPYTVLASKIHGPGSCWVAQDTFDANASAQEIRDRLGLWNYPEGNTIGDQLVYLGFKVKLSSLNCPDKFDPNFSDTIPDGLWLIRPTVIDNPNVRFSQAHDGDTVGAAKSYGKTIDISSDEYFCSEREFILLAGRDVKLQWVSLKLLSGGLPIRRDSDYDHEKFVNAIENRVSSII